MSYKMTGTIVSMSEAKTLSNGAHELTYRIDTGEEYNNIQEFQVYKKAEHAEHMNNFIKYNKVGDKVEVEFNIRTFNWKPEADNKIFTSLSHWKIEKLDGVDTQPIDNQDDMPF